MQNQIPMLPSVHAVQTYTWKIQRHNPITKLRFYKMGFGHNYLVCTSVDELNYLFFPHLPMFRHYYENPLKDMNSPWQNYATFAPSRSRLPIVCVVCDQAVFGTRFTKEISGGQKISLTNSFHFFPPQSLHGTIHWLGKEKKILKNLNFHLARNL